MVSCRASQTSHADKTVREKDAESGKDGVGKERTWLWPKNAMAQAPGVLCVVGIIHRKCLESV